MKITEVENRGKLTPEDRAWALKHLPGTDPQGARILEQLGIPPDQGFKLTSVSNVSQQASGNHRGIYVMYSPDDNADRTPIYWYVGLAANAFIPSRQRDPFRFKPNLSNKLGNRDGEVVVDGVKYYPKAQPSFSTASFTGWYRTAKKFLEPESFERLKNYLNDQYSQGKQLQNGYWERWTARPDPKTNKLLGPDGEPTTQENWIKFDDLEHLNLKMNPRVMEIGRPIPLAVLNMNNFSNDDIDWAETQFISLYKPISNNAKINYDINAQAGLTANDWPQGWRQPENTSGNKNNTTVSRPGTPISPQELDKLKNLKDTSLIGKNRTRMYIDFLSRKPLFQSMLNSIPQSKRKSFIRDVSNLATQHRYNLNTRQSHLNGARLNDRINQLFKTYQV